MKPRSNTTLTCKGCGWFINNPTKQDEQGKCCNCGKHYYKTKSFSKRVDE